MDQSITNTNTLTFAEQPIRKYIRLANFLEKICRDYFDSGRGTTCTLQWKNSPPHKFGRGNPDFGVIIKDQTGIASLTSLDSTSFLEAYTLGHIDIWGSIEKMFAFRAMLADKHFFSYKWSLIKPWLFGQTRLDRSGISSHYDLPQEFYLSFLDERHRCYSQGIFNADTEDLETAMTRKLDFALNAIDVKAGDHVLDIGGGWSAFNEYAGKKGIRVTSLTISNESEKFIKALIKKENLPCDVINCHLYEYAPAGKFDAIVNLGVTEHLPDYKRSLGIYNKLLKPGGKIYLDASASRKKFNFHSFIYKHIYPGNCSPLCLHDYLKNLANTPFRLLGVWDDRHNYYLTARHWAEKLERNRNIAVTHGGELSFRKFQVYLWGTVDVFRRDIMQAYRIVLESPK